MKRFILLLPAFLISLATYGQDEKIWTLEECINYALDNNIDIRQSALRIEGATYDINAAWANLFPNLNGSFGYNFNFGLNIDPVTNLIARQSRQTSNMGLNSQWVLFDGFRNKNNIDRARLERDIQQADYEQRKVDLTLNLTGAYLQILLSKEVVRIAREQVRISELQVTRMRDLVKAGAEPRGSLYELEAQLARDEQNLIRNENDLLLNKLSLSQILQLKDFDEDFDVVNPVNDLPTAEVFEFTENYIFGRALEMQPGVKRANLQQVQADKDIALAKGQRYPTLSLIGAVSTNYSNQIQDFQITEPTLVPFGQTSSGETVFVPSDALGMNRVSTGRVPFGNQVYDNVNEFVGISLNIPIYSRLQIRNAVRNAELQRLSADLDYEREVNRVRQDVQRAYTDAKASLKAYRAAEKAVKASREAFDYATERFRVGAIQQYDFENAKNALAQAQAEQASALYEYVFKIKVLEFYVNNELKL
ncbi:MAG: TolC family protein [Cryomorphaceae bacterium]|nr:TolC family protein [Cryomorphaceae bacterium]